MVLLRTALIGFICLGAFGAFGAFGALAKATPEAAAVAGTTREAAAAARIIVAAQECPAGYHYEAGHYARHGKWRDAGCWPN